MTSRAGRAALAFLGFFALPAGAQEEQSGAPPATSESAPAPSREAQWRRLREEKARRLAPERPGLVHRNLLSIEKAERPGLRDVNLGRLHPRLQNIASGSWPAVGVRLWRPDLGRTRVDVHASAFHSLRGFEYYDVQVGRLPHGGRSFPPRSVKADDVYELGDVRTPSASRLIAHASARYEHYPHTPFFGLGPGSRRRDETKFLFQDAVYDAVAGWRLDARHAVTARVGYLQTFVGPGSGGELSVGDRFGEAEAPGLGLQPDFWRWSISVLADHRDTPGNPHRGFFVALSYGGFDDRGSSAFAFHRLGADARVFIPLGSPQRVFALRVRASTDEPRPGARVPFYLQDTLGGNHSLRSFPNFRFRGERLVLVQSEYRWEAWPALELALFVDAGTVAGAGRSLALSRLEADGGIGLRLKTAEVTRVRFDAAWGGEGGRFAASLVSSF